MELWLKQFIFSSLITIVGVLIWVRIKPKLILFLQKLYFDLEKDKNALKKRYYDQLEKSKQDKNQQDKKK